MAGYRTHKVVGGAVGATVAFAYAQNQPPLLAIAETLGGLLAGRHAGTWADIAEPAYPHITAIFAMPWLPPPTARRLSFGVWIRCKRRSDPRRRSTSNKPPARATGFNSLRTSPPVCFCMLLPARFRQFQRAMFLTSPSMQ